MCSACGSLVNEGSRFMPAVLCHSFHRTFTDMVAKKKNQQQLQFSGDLNSACPFRLLNLFSELTGQAEKITWSHQNSFSVSSVFCHQKICENRINQKTYQQFLICHFQFQGDLFGSIARVAQRCEDASLEIVWKITGISPPAPQIWLNLGKTQEK